MFAIVEIQRFVTEYEICICKQAEYINIDSSSTKASSESLGSPPAYEPRPHSTVTVTAPRTKANFLGRIFARIPKKPACAANELPSYRETELVEAWSKVGIDINDRKQGPRPKCTPEELLQAMDGLFGSRTVSSAM